jgi:tRNA modification GTPase
VPTDTIFALASGRPPAAIAIIRVSGPGAHDAGRRLAGELPEPRRAMYRELRDAAGAILDQALALRFDGPASATGEDVVEFHIHGGRAVGDAVLTALAAIDGLRLAEPGEFTRRAFENGRIDLTEAEGLADLLEAETEVQRRAALALADGGLRRQVEQWQQDVLELSARAEAVIDYAEESDVGADPALGRDSAALANGLSTWLDRPRIEPLRDGIRVVVVGPPNTGKSSLVNAIAGSDKAIVTPIPGTTRDQVEVPLALEGIPLLLIDTAGIRESEEPVEQIGVERARALLKSADVLLWLGDPADLPAHPRRVQVHSRADLPGRQSVPAGAIAVSALSGQGISALLERVAELARTLIPVDDALALNRRQAACLAEAQVQLLCAAEAADPVLAAEHLRLARSAFDRLTGRAGVEEVLDALFGRFCLGK